MRKERVKRPFLVMEHTGLEPVTPTLPVSCAPERHAYTPPKAGDKIVLPFVYYYTHVSGLVKTDIVNIHSAHSSFPPLCTTIWVKGVGNAMKYVRQPKRHIVLDDFERRAPVKGLNEYRKQVIDEDGCVEVINELLIKIIDAPTKKIKVTEVSK